MKTCWDRLIRFRAQDGRVLYGEPICSDDFDLGHADTGSKLRAKIIAGSDMYDESGQTRITDEIVEVNKVLGPLTMDTVPIIRCIGLNYLTHINEIGIQVPDGHPTMFMKASTAVHDHGEDIVVPAIAQDDEADYEGELCVVIGKPARDVPLAHALEYVAGYTVGNDVSSRKIQSDPTIAGPMPQACFSKGFDTYAPMGPVLVSSTTIPDPSKLKLETRVDGELRQEGQLSDLKFSIPYLIHYLSIGTTLQKGSVIMTGTPGGVGCFLKPPRFLAPGNHVHVWVKGIGTLKNGICYA